MGKMILVFKNVICIGAMSIVALCFLGCNDNRHITVEDTIEVLNKPCFKETPNNKVIAVLNKGDEAEIISEGYEKDCKFYKVQLHNGSMGYIIHGDKFIVEPRNN